MMPVVYECQLDLKEMVMGFRIPYIDAVLGEFCSTLDIIRFCYVLQRRCNVTRTIRKLRKLWSRGKLARHGKTYMYYVQYQ